MTSKTEHELIVVPLDGSEQAEQVIPYAEALRDRGGTLLFFQVVDPSGPASGLFGDIEIAMEEVIQEERDAAKARLTEIGERWEDVLGKKPAVESYAGDTVEAIKTIIDERRATMLAIASSGRGTLSRLAFGSVADKLMRDAQVPTLIVHPDPHADGEPLSVEFNRILVLLDGSEIAEAALPEAARLSNGSKLPVMLVQVINPSLEYSMIGQGMAPISPELYNDVEKDFVEQANKDLERGITLLGDVPAGSGTAVLQGGTVEAIQHYSLPGDLIVMTTHGRTGFRRFLLGSVAQKVINERVAPVVLVPTKAIEDNEKK